jgi:hypothetical protein
MEYWKFFSAALAYGAQPDSSYQYQSLKTLIPLSMPYKLLNTKLVVNVVSD